MEWIPEGKRESGQEVDYRLLFSVLLLKGREIGVVARGGYGTKKFKKILNGRNYYSTFVC